MAEYSFTIRLTADAEPGTGLGGETINQFAPRDHQGRWVLNASHIKGLMRQALFDVVDAFSPSAEHWTEELLAATFGIGDDESIGIESIVRLTNAVADQPAEVTKQQNVPSVKGATAESKIVTRTAIGEKGVVKPGALRTTESIPAGTVFRGTLYSQAKPGSIEDLAWRLALIAIPAVGGNRNRGSGLCVVELGGGEKPSELLAQLDEKLRRGQPELRPFPHEPGRPLSDGVVVLRLTFRAEAPICCPEISDKTNVIATGFSIPASAVQGAILHRLNTIDAPLATATFDHQSFRAWPLQPCRHPDDRGEGDLPTAIRVSLTHRASKFFHNDQSTEADFQDEAIKPYRWPTTSHGAPLKASDGVLLRDAGGKVQLWQASNMPHVITSHGVHRDLERLEADGTSRNLFTVDAMAPMTWQGLVVLPAEAADAFKNSIASDPTIAFGKSRSVRGVGLLKVEVVQGTPPEWQTPSDATHTVLIVQSPILLDRQPGKSADEELRAMAEAWSRDHLDGAVLGYRPGNEPYGSQRPCWANVGIRFGWRRHKTSGHNGGFLHAKRVVLPGSVISFAKRLPDDQLREAIKRGFYLGDDGGRQLGFGAVSVHPGRATDEYKFARQQVEKGSSLKDAIAAVAKMRSEKLPSPSQIRAVKAKIENADVQAGRDYLSSQLDRTTRVWYAWEPIHKSVDQMLASHDKQKDVAVRALEVLADLASVSLKGRNT